MDYPKRGEVWLVRLDPVVGHEIGKTRPAIVISNDRNNEFASVITVVPLSSRTEKAYPYETFLAVGEANLRKDSKAKPNQIRTTDKQRMKKFLGKISPHKMKQLERAVLIHLGFAELIGF